jgi:hypothetical protein
MGVEVKLCEFLIWTLEVAELTASRAGPWFAAALRLSVFIVSRAAADGGLATTAPAL